MQRRREDLVKPNYKEVRSANSTLFKNYPQPVTATMAQIEEQSRRPPARQQQQLTMIVDVFGRETEPICNYHTCHNKFSLHGSTRVCKCSHPQNYTIGISL
jgi:hypothetical protein